MAAKTIFDHLKGVTKDKVPWDSLSEEDQKSWNNFMITKWLSMHSGLTVLMNDFQKYANGILSSKDYYTLLYHALPQMTFYVKYTKRTVKFDVDMKFIDLFCKHYGNSKRTIYTYIGLLKDSHLEELVNVLKMYGTQDGDIALFRKQIAKLKS